MTSVDKQYIDLIKDILEHGTEKDTRSGKTLSVFGRQLRFDLKQGLPILTVKKVFTKGIIHELLWFLKGDTNISYLVRNNVHIWDDDAYRWYNNLFSINPNKLDKNNSLDKQAFIEKILRGDSAWYKSKEDGTYKYYKFGDLGDVYGKQWRNYGNSGFDQIKHIIDTLKNNPDDRRMLCVAYNPDVLNTVALPPCHVMFQFYTRKMTLQERWEAYRNKFQNDEEKKLLWSKTQSPNYDGQYDIELDNENIPTRTLSCMWTQRSVDVPLGLCWNISSYGFLLCMVAKIVNMIPEELIGSLGDCHIYLNQMEGIQEQLKRNGYDELPKLIIDGNQESLEEFKYEDFHIIGYKSDDIIKMPLSVG